MWFSTAVGLIRRPEGSGLRLRLQWNPEADLLGSLMLCNTSPIMYLGCWA
jgi:hypothetical protein